MLPTMNLMAMVRAYDPATPYAQNRKELRQQIHQFLSQIEPLLPVVESLTVNLGKKHPKKQFKFDALLSIAFDMGIDSFMKSPLPELISVEAPKKDIMAAIESTPKQSSILRPELVEQLYQYRLVKEGFPIPSRRHYEALLFDGVIHFAIGPTQTPDGTKAFGPLVLHPFFLFR